MPARLANFILWFFGPLDAYLAKLSVARLQALFDVNGPVTWRDLSPFTPVRSAEGDRHAQ